MLAGFASPLAATADDDVPQHSRLLEKRRQVYEVEEALSAQKEEFARREAAFARREEALRRKDLELQETLVRFNQTIAENETKRVRAEKKALEDRGAATAKEDELYACLSQLAGLKEELSLLQTEKAKLSKYHRFLDAFQREHGEEYADIDGVLERFGTLRTAHRDLLSDQQRSSREIEEQRRNVARLQKASAMQAINHENLSARLSRHLEDTRALVGSLQSGADEAAVRRGLRLMELGQVLQSVYNLHSRCTGCAHGEVLRHTPADGEALGLGRGAFAEPDAPAAEDDPSSGAGGAGGSGGGAAPAASPGGSRASRPSSAMPRDRDGSGGGAGGGGGGDAGGAGVAVDGDDEDGPPPPHAATPAAPSTKQLAAEAADVRALRARLRTAVGLLHVAGSYVVDLSAMVAEYGQWREARREEEARREALAAEEAKRLAAARAARAGGAAGGKGSAGAGGAGGPGSPGRSGARGAGAAASGATALPAGSGMRLASSGYGAGISVGSPGGKGMGTSMGMTMTMTTTGGAAGAGGTGGAHGPAGAGTGASAVGFTSGPIVDKRGTKTWVVRGAQLPSSMAAKLAAVGGRTAAEAAEKVAESASPAGGSSLNSSTVGKR